MNVTVFANETIFPFLLFLVFVYLTIVRFETQSTEAVAQNTDVLEVDNNSLDEFYEIIEHSNYWQSELNSIDNRQQLIDKLIAIAASNGFYFTASDVERSIEHHTDNRDNYVCLPIGCWRVV